MRTDVRNRMVMLGALVTMQARPRVDGHRRWLIIRPHDTRGVILVDVEVRVDLDPDGYAGPDDIGKKSQRDVDTLDDALAYLTSEGIDSAEFDAPWTMDYPL